MSQLKILGRLLLCLTIVAGFTACGGGGGSHHGGGEGEYHLTGYSGEDASDADNPYDLYAEFPWWVNFSFQVSTPNCEGVSGLTADDFIVKEDGKKLIATETELRVYQRDTLPSDFEYTLDTVLLLDNTPSQTGNLDLIKEAAHTVIDSLDEKRQQRVAIVAFNNQGEPFVKQEFTDDLSTLNQCLITGQAARENEDALQPATGATNFYGAVIKGLSLWEDDLNPEDKILRQGMLVAITDGKDTTNLYDIEDALAKRGRKQVYTVGVGSENIPENIQSELRQLGNAGYFPVAKPAREADEGFDDHENLSETLQEIQNQILCFADGFYWLKYKSPSTSEDENLNHTVAVSIEDNRNTGEDALVRGEFSSADFFTGKDGVYIEASGSDPDGVDEVTLNVQEGQSTDSVTETVDAVSVADDKEKASQFEWTSSDESVFTVKPEDNDNSTGIITAQGNGKANLIVKDTANSLETVITVNVIIHVGPYEFIKHSNDTTPSWFVESNPPWFVDPVFQVRMKEDGATINNQWQWVTDLSTEDFSIYENNGLINNEAAELNIRKRDTMPTDFSYTLKTVLLIDNTPSIRENLDHMKEAAKVYVENALNENPLLNTEEEPQQEIAIWTFTEQGDSPKTVWQNFTTDPAELKDAIDNITPGSGSTDFYGGMVDALNLCTEDYHIWEEETKAEPADKNLSQGVVVAMTDGNHTSAPSLTFDAVIGERGKKQVMTIGVGDDLVSRVNVDELKEISNGGFYSVPAPGEEIVISTAKKKNITKKALNFTTEIIHQQIMDYANSFYWLEYRSKVEPASDCSVLDNLEVRIKNNENPEEDAVLQGKFQSCEFVRLIPGKVYLNPSASNPDGVEGPIGLKVITLMGKSEFLLGSPSYDLKAITHQPEAQPNYIWWVESGNNIIIDVDENSYANYRATVRVDPDNPVEGPAWARVKDIPNDNFTELQFNIESTELTPIAYYPFNGNANDEVNVHDGEAKGAALTHDRFGNANSAYYFDGKDDYIELNMFYGPDNGTISEGQTVDEITVCAWVKPQNVQNSERWCIVTFDGTEYWRLQILKGKANFAVNVSGESQLQYATKVSSPKDMPEQEWHFVCGSFKAESGKNLKLYIDGDLVNAVETGANPIGAGDTRKGIIGRGLHVDSLLPSMYSFNGAIDEVAVFNVELTAEQILAYYQATK